MPPRTLLGALLLASATVASGANAPSQAFANTFRLAEAGAVLQVCFASEAFKGLPEEKVARFKGLATRLAALVSAMGSHYRDQTLLPTYGATMDRIATESRLRLHVKNHYAYCGDNLAESMEGYVVENESMIQGFLKAETLKGPQRK